MKTAENDVLYRIDARDAIVDVSPAWDWFASANGGAHLLASRVLGSSLWELITDPTIVEIYGQLFESVRRGRSLHVDFRCDAPDLVRRQRLHISPFGDTLELRAQVLSTTKRAPVDLDAVPGDGTLVKMCSWCKRVEHGGEWLELEEAVTRRSFFERASKITHGMCSDCERRLEETPKGG